MFQWVTPYMISPDEANLGVKAIFVWAGLLVPTIALLYFFYPEVSSENSSSLSDLRHTDEHTSSWTNFTNEAFPHGNSARLKQRLTRKRVRTPRSCRALPGLPVTIDHCTTMRESQGSARALNMIV